MEHTTIIATILALPFLLLVLSIFDPSKNSSVASPLLRWLQRKRYQYEVTFSLYMLTPTEKFVLNSFLFLTLSLTLIACSLYLPEHILKMWHRAFYYYSGSSIAVPTKAVATATSAVVASLGSTATEAAQAVLTNTTAAVEAAA